MAERLRLESGTLELVGEDWFLDRIRPVVERAVRQERRENGVHTEDGLRAYCKLGPLRGHGRWRHAARALWPGLDVPRLQEFANLAWLRRNGFRAPQPLAAGCVRNALGLPIYQFLYTREVEGARTLRQLFEAGPSPRRIPVLEELGRELARLHGRKFTHRDLFPRNLLVTEEKGAPHVHFLDAWRGGPLRGLRGPTYDLACLMLFGVDLFAPEEQNAFFRAYFGERARLGHGVKREKMLASAARQRRGLHRRFVKRRRPGSALPVPAAEWIP